MVRTVVPRVVPMVLEDGLQIGLLIPGLLLVHNHSIALPLFAKVLKSIKSWFMFVIGGLVRTHHTCHLQF